MIWEGNVKLPHRRQFLQLAVGAAALPAIACVGFVITTSTKAQEFPSKNITLMMPYAAGGPGDTLTRIIGQGMGKALGRQILVENVAGAGGTIGTAKAAASAPDGHSLLVMHFGHAANTALYRNLRYDPIKDFEPIGMIAESPMAFVARKDFPASNFHDFVAHVKTNMEKVVHGHAGIGSASHLCGLLFLNAIEATVTVVPYRGTGPALNDLIGGQFDFMCDQTLNVLQSIKGGMVRAYAATTKKRLAVLRGKSSDVAKISRSACARPRMSLSTALL
jgi:tripartite-type tricarboxylate transporter receptor subunit TctC